MHVSLTSELERIVREKVASGLYNNASEVIREALRQMIAQEEDAMWQKERLHQLVSQGLAEADAGLFVDMSMEEILEEARKEKHGET